MRFGFPITDELELDDEEAVLFDFILRLRFLQNKLEEEFDAAFKAWDNLVVIEDAVANEWKAMGENIQIEPPDSSVNQIIPTLVMPIIYTPGLYAAELREEATLLQAESSAGSFILMLDDVFQRLRHEIVDSTGKPVAAEFKFCEILDGAGYVTTLVYAAGNAYRHAKDWNGLVDMDGIVNVKHRQYSKAKTTLAILDATIGLNSVAGENVCIAALAILSMESASCQFDVLWDKLDVIAREFASDHGTNCDAYERVQNALEYQEAYNSIEVSFSMDERLFRASDEE
jgi:hypothetical protein